MRRFITDALEKLNRGTSLRARMLRGGIFLGAGSGAEQGLRFLRNMIIARLLAPEAFGLLAIILAVNSAFESFTEVGIKEAIIQSPKGLERTYLNGAWWLSFARSSALFAVAYAAAPWIADLYGSRELLPMMRIVFLSIIFNGLISSKAYVALKEMNYRRWVVISNGGGICGIITAIALTFFIQNVWALIIGFAVEAASRCILSYIICPFRPGFDFERENLRSLFKYSRGMFGLPILFLVFTHTDIFVIAKLFPKEDLGLYSMALSLAQVPAMFISVLINPIMMPAFSEMGGQNERINNAVIKATSFLSLLGFPALLFAALYGRDVLTVIYGPRYAQVAVPFVILFAATLLRTCSAPIVTVYLAAGRPALHRLFMAARAFLMVVLIYPFIIWFGLAGAAIAGLAAMILAYVLQVMRLKM
ncbi:MAG: oligosaccharide flippase family protein, partial [Planctomycetes bacterium]|nr:oligosaccharide flippase family protein [Planctomycetota bacterium]